MTNERRLTALALLILIGLSIAACNIDVERDPDGSLNVASEITAQSLQSEIAAGINDPLMKDSTVELHDGYITVCAARQLPNSDHVDELTFRLDLGVSDGHLTATVSEARLNNQPIGEARAATWNERIARRLERAGRRNPDSALQAVTVTPETLSMVWHVSTARSRGG